MRHLRPSAMLLAVCALAACSPSSVTVGAEEDASSITRAVSADGYLDKVTVGYQGWFAAPGDGSSMGEWVHWSRGGAPSPGNMTVELYPDTREYDARDLFDTGLGRLRNGQPAKLFSSHSQRVMDLHFKWMQENGLDGVGLQRFVATLADARHKAFRNSVTRMVRSAAERHGRIFYIEYDFSGAPEATWAEDIKRDWNEVMLSQLDVTASPQYVRQGGKPVVALWGFGFPDRPGSAAQSVDLIDWFKAQGCYVVGGVPYGWRTGGGTKPGFMPAFERLDVIQPWAVGALETEADAEAHRRDYIEPDAQYARQHGAAYQRVIFPGFAWSNWNGGGKNMIPRRAGRFLWAQATAAKRANVPVFIAMFDEYDEGTAIAKAAEDPSMTPASQYFLSLDADGTRVSSDFYLRLAGAVTRLMKGQLAPSAEVPVPPFATGAPPPPPASPPENPPATPPATDPVPKQSAMAEDTVATFSGAQADVVVERLYRAVLGREVDPSGRGAYVPLVQQGRLPVVVNALITSGEFDQHRAGVSTSSFAAELYRVLLDREPDPGGHAATADAVRAAHGAQRVADMVLSGEYAEKNP
ncbi:MAG: hypothetical protein ACYC8T_32355 [Myxococcaceae bacterium]